MDNIINPRRPSGTGWMRHPLTRAFAARVAQMGGYPTETWAHEQGNIWAITSVEVANDPGQPELGPEYHLSVSAMGERCTPEQAAWVLQQFGLEDAREDNHTPDGKVRHFWRPVADKLSGYECPCIANEPAMREDKGSFVWRGVTK